MRPGRYEVHRLEFKTAPTSLAVRPGNEAFSVIGLDAALISVHDPRRGVRHALRGGPCYVHRSWNIPPAGREDSRRAPLGRRGGRLYWQPLAERYGIDIPVRQPEDRPTFALMTLEPRWKIRM